MYFSRLKHAVQKCRRRHPLSHLLLCKDTFSILGREGTWTKLQKKLGKFRPGKTVILAYPEADPRGFTFFTTPKTKGA